MSSLCRAKMKGPPAVAATAKAGLWNMERVHGSHSPADHSAADVFRPISLSISLPSGLERSWQLKRILQKSPIFGRSFANQTFFPSQTSFIGQIWRQILMQMFCNEKLTI